MTIDDALAAVRSSRTMHPSIVLFVVLSFLGCDSPPAPAIDAGTDAARLCSTEADCDDGAYCNGVELCAPGMPIACAGGATCDETMDACVVSCGATLDADGDGQRSIACGGNDCDDADPRRFPGNAEVCDAANVDEDCDAATYGARDVDGDGHNDAACCNVGADGTPRCGGDCDDARRAVSPDAPELCNGTDDDCDDAMDEGVLVDTWPDADGDMFGDAMATPLAGCPAADLATNGDDCDDASAMRNPAIAEVCNGVDDDCDGMLDGPGEDDDGDGHADDQCAGSGASDCDDGDDTVYDGAPELCDGLDQDCSNPGHRRVPGGMPENDADASEDRDGDRHASPFLDTCMPTAALDCDDGNPLRHSDGVESCNGIDDDCDSIVDEAPRAGGPTACAFVDVAPTQGATCAALGDGTVWCWGSAAGSTFTTRRTDVSDVIDLGAGDQHTCAVTRAGEVWCWGSNAVGQLGDGTRIDRASAVRVVGIDDALSVDAAWGSLFGGNAGFSCALRASGAVMCWGSGSFGQLGNGSNTDSDVPIAVPGITDAIELDVGQRTGCVRRTTGRVMCWGQNANGELGLGTTTHPSGPGEVLTITDAISIGVGESHACAVRTGGSVWCWGSNDTGQLGRGGAAGGVFGTPAMVAGITGAIDVAADQNLTCATRSTGRADCWGENVNGRTGDGTTTSPRTAPVQVMGLPDGARIELGRTHGCAVTTGGDVRCWGANFGSQLGDGGTGATAGAVAVHRHGPPVQVDVGASHACVRRQLGDVWCWGNNSVGAVGQGAAAALQPAARVSGTGAVTRIAAGRSHSCALRGDGTVVCWGDNPDGRLGDGTITRRTAPTLVSGLTDAVEVSAGDATTCARRRSGAIACWGAGTRTPAPLAGVTDAIALDVGWHVACAVSTTGGGMCWGEEYVGELGDGGFAMSTAASPVALAGIDDAIDVGHGIYSGCVRRSDASVWCWGSNAGGFAVPQFMVGDGTTTDRPAPVMTHAGPARDLGPGTNSACLVRTDGRLMCWGSNFQGGVGDGSPGTPRPAPVALDATLIATDVDCEGNITGEVCCAIANGAPYCWGYGRQGELGGTTDQSTPTRVPRF